MRYHKATKVAASKLATKEGEIPAGKLNKMTAKNLAPNKTGKKKIQKIKEPVVVLPTPALPSIKDLVNLEQQASNQPPIPDLQKNNSIRPSITLGSKRLIENPAMEIPLYGKAMFFTDIPVHGEELVPVPKVGGHAAQLAPNFDIKVIKNQSFQKQADQKYLDNIDLTIKEFMYVHSMNHYQSVYGFPLLKLTLDILEGPEYKKIKVERGLQLFSLFNLVPSEQWLFKFALLLDALPLPPDILERDVEGRKEYVFLGYTLKNIQRPPYFYVMEVISYLKRKVVVNPEWMFDKQTIFYDEIGRECQNLNIKQVYRDWITQQTKTKIINFTETRRKEETVPDESQKHDKHKHQALIDNIFTKRYKTELVSEISSSRQS